MSMVNEFHNVENKTEIKRIENCGGKILFECDYPDIHSSEFYHNTLSKCLQYFQNCKCCKRRDDSRKVVFPGFSHTTRALGLVHAKMSSSGLYLSKGFSFFFGKIFTVKLFYFE